MESLDNLFTFPIVMVDGENEERKEELYGKNNPVDYEIIYGEASLPYYDFIGVEDRWLPTQESLQKAKRGRFDACIVRFSNTDPYLVPMKKSKFLDIIKSFSEDRDKINEERALETKITMIKLDNTILDIIKKSDSDEGK